MKEVIANQIRELLPVESFKKPYQREYDYQIWVNGIAEDIQERLPKNQCIEVVDDKLFIVTKEPELEGYEKFVHDARKIYTMNDNKIPFADHLENTINETHWRKLLK